MLEKSQDESGRVVKELLEEQRSGSQNSVVQWPSGRKINLRFSSNFQEDSLDIVSPDGALEISLKFTESGPKLVAPEGKLGLITSSLNIQSDQINFDVESDVSWKVGGQFQVSSQATIINSDHDVEINGRLIKLNCDPQTVESEQSNELKSEIQKS